MSLGVTLHWLALGLIPFSLPAETSTEGKIPLTLKPPGWLLRTTIKDAVVIQQLPALLAEVAI